MSASPCPSETMKAKTEHGESLKAMMFTVVSSMPDPLEATQETFLNV